MHDVGCPSISFCLILLVVTVTLQSNLVRASPNPYPNELEEIAAEKRAWNNFHGGYGKRAWNNFNGGYGKRSSIAYDYDEQPERDTDNLYDIEEDKRAWNSGFNGGIGKRAWNSGFNGGVGKRAWNNFNGGYGKRAWNNFNGGYGKRAWNNFNGGYGKRSTESHEEDIEHIENGEIPMLDKKSWTSRSLRGIWGKRSNTPTKRAIREIPMLDKRSWNSRGLRGGWGKRSNNTPTKRAPKRGHTATWISIRGHWG